MSTRWLFTAVGILAMLAGTGLWLANRLQPHVVSPHLDAAALFASTLRDAQGNPQPLRQYAGKVLVLNFWATWCAPCRAEMPALSRLQTRFESRGVQFLGLTSDDPARVARFAREVAVSYPLLTGGSEVDSLSTTLGNRDRLLPFTVVIDRSGRVTEQHVGAYSEETLAEILRRAAPEPAANGR